MILSSLTYDVHIFVIPQSSFQSNPQANKQEK